MPFPSDPRLSAQRSLSSSGRKGTERDRRATREQRGGGSCGNTDRGEVRQSYGIFRCVKFRRRDRCGDRHRRSISSGLDARILETWNRQISCGVRLRWLSAHRVARSVLHARGESVERQCGEAPAMLCTPVGVAAVSMLPHVCRCVPVEGFLHTLVDASNSISGA